MPRELPRDDRAAGSPGTYVSPRPTSDSNADDNVTREPNAFLRDDRISIGSRRNALVGPRRYF